MSIELGAKFEGTIWQIIRIAFLTNQLTIFIDA